MKQNKTKSKKTTQTDTQLHNGCCIHVHCTVYFHYDYDILRKSDKLFGSNNRDEHKKCSMN